MYFKKKNMCFDVPWKTDRLRLMCWYRNRQLSVTFCGEDVMFSYNFFLNQFGCDRASQTQFDATEPEFRQCLQAALCHTRAPALLNRAMCRPDAQPNKAYSMRAVISDLSQRYNDMQPALLIRVAAMNKHETALCARNAPGCLSFFFYKFFVPSKITNYVCCF